MVFGTEGYREKSGNRPLLRVLSDEKGSCFCCKSLKTLRFFVFPPKAIEELCRRKIGRIVRLNTLLNREGGVHKSALIVFLVSLLAGLCIEGVDYLGDRILGLSVVVNEPRTVI